MVSIYDDIRWLINVYFKHDVEVFNEGMTTSEKLNIGIKVLKSYNVLSHDGNDPIRYIDVVLQVYSENPTEARDFAYTIGNDMRTVVRQVHERSMIIFIDSEVPVLLRRFVGGAATYGVRLKVIRR